MAAAAAGGRFGSDRAVGLQTLHNWVPAFIADSPAGLIGRKAPSNWPKLDAAQRRALARPIEEGPAPGKGPSTNPGCSCPSTCARGPISNDHRRLILEKSCSATLSRCNRAAGASDRSQRCPRTRERRVGPEGSEQEAAC